MITFRQSLSGAVEPITGWRRYILLLVHPRYTQTVHLLQDITNLKIQISTRLK